MAKMIPPRIDPRTPSSERRLFEFLQSDPGTEEWVVLHSLGLAHRSNKPYGEIDFVVLVPSGGVACIEVKGGRVRCKDGIWYTKNRNDIESTLSRSPFQQAREGMFALKDAIEKHFGSGADAARIPFSSLVVFPDIEAPPGTPEFERWEAIGVGDLRQSISTHITRALTEQTRRVGPSGRERLGTPEVMRQIRNFLRPDFDVGIARSTTIQRSEERIVRLTDEQYDVLDLFALNDRCLVEGAAGTGKTMLALEFARRMASPDRRVHLLCFNRLLGDWLSHSVRESGEPGITTGTFHSCLREMILGSSLAAEFQRAEEDARTQDRMAEFFREGYLLFAQIALAEGASQTDLLILDEGQDLLRPEILEVLNAWLAGGLSGGRWVVLGDFTRQSLYGSAGASVDAGRLLSAYTTHFTSTVLRKNCRNTRRIGEETALLSGFEALPYRLDSEDCLAVDYRYWSDAGHQRRRLEEILIELHDDRVPFEDVVILSPRRIENSVVSQLDRNRFPIRVAAEVPERGQNVHFSTVHAFKGLESPVVILCDLEDLEEDHSRALLYTGMSRARSHLILLLRNRLQKSVSAAVERKLRTGWAQ
jgi:hypothetical protein